MITLFRLLLCTSVLMVVAGSAGAQSAASYPNKPVRVIIPFAQGSAAETVMTIFGDRFNRELGQPFIFDRRGGADTMLGTAAGAKATPDGYTLLMATTTLLINHWLYPDRQYDTLKDITLISQLTRSNSALAINPSVPVNNLNEFIAHARANPGKINMASTATGAVLHYQRFMNATGTKFTIVNYKGGAQALTDLIAGNVQGFMNNVSNLAPHIKAGKLKGIAVGGSKRSSVAPDMPTYAEAGLPEFDPNNWIALMIPSKTPREIIEKMNTQVRRAQANPELISTLDKQGLLPGDSMSLPQNEDFMRAELDRFGKLIKDAGLKAEAS